MKTPMTLALLALAMLAATEYAAAREQAPAQRAILVTGASSGIGRNITQRLAADGHFVYAGARKQADIDELSAMDNVQGIRLDVNVPEEIDAAVDTITKAGRGLYGLVNNAGVAVIGPLIEIDEEDLFFQMNANVFGPYRVTKAFAPLIIESKGRITTTGSISGILSGTLFGPYSMSKHAVEAYTDSLAQEMEKFEVAVSVIEPGNYSSDIFQNTLARMQSRGVVADGSLYEEELSQMMARAGSGIKYQEPDAVSAAVSHFLFDTNPKRRYMVVPNERQAKITIEKAIEELVQLNENHAYSYDRTQLIAMLDAALAATAPSQTN